MPDSTLFIGLFLMTCVLGYLFGRNRRESQSKSKTKTLTNKNRGHGEWNPESFNYPAIEAYSFDPRTVPAIPYRPFKWNVYPITMGIRSMNWNEWIQIDEQYDRYITIRKERSQQLGRIVNRTTEGFRLHAMETLVELAAFLSVRYPDMFVVTRMKYDANRPESWGESVAGAEAGAILTITNHATGNVFNIAQLESDPEWDPMDVVAVLVQDDIAVMVENNDGEYVLRSGSVCTAGSWRLQDKLNKTLDQIHRVGKVVGWEDKLKLSMERFFRKLKTDKCVERNNYFMQTEGDLAWWEGSSGPEDVFDDALKGPIPGSLETSSNPSWKKTEFVESPLDLWFRNERQTLRRLPKSGAIVFTIRTYLFPLSEMKDELGVPGRMASSLRAWTPELHAYKGSAKYIDTLMTYLDGLHQKQLDEGSVQVNKEGFVEVIKEGKVVEVPKYPF